MPGGTVSNGLPGLACPPTLSTGDKYALAWKAIKRLGVTFCSLLRRSTYVSQGQLKRPVCPPFLEPARPVSRQSSRGTEGGLALVRRKSHSAGRWRPDKQDGPGSQCAQCENGTVCWCVCFEQDRPGYQEFQEFQASWGAACLQKWCACEVETFPSSAANEDDAWGPERLKAGRLSATDGAAKNCLL